MPAKRPVNQARPYACDYPECSQSFAEFAHLRSHQRSHQNKNKKIKTTTSTPTSSSSSHNIHHSTAAIAAALGTPPHSTPSSSQSTPLSDGSGDPNGLTPLSTAPSSPRLPVPQTAQEYLLQRKLLQQQQQQLLYMPTAAASPVARKSKRKQPTPVKSPKRPDCLEKPPGIVFVFPTWLDLPKRQSREASLTADDDDTTASSSSSTSSIAQQQQIEGRQAAKGAVDLAQVDVGEVEEQYQRKPRPTPLRLNSTDFVVLVHPTTDKQLLANTLEKFNHSAGGAVAAGKKGLKKAPLSQDAEAASVTTQVAVPAVPTGTNSPTTEPMDAADNGNGNGKSGLGTSPAQVTLIHERMAEDQVVMA